MRVNVSAVKSYQINPRRWHYEYILGRVPRTRAVPLDIGTAAHRVLADHFLGSPIEAALQNGDAYVAEAKSSMLVRAQFEQAEDLMAEWSTLRTLLGSWTSQYEVETIAVEQVLDKQLPGSAHILYGTPDRVVRWQGQFWHVQNRTLSATTPIAPYLRAASLNMHELAYAWLISQHGMTPYGGTLFNIIRKLKLIGAKGKALHTPEECFVQEFIPLSAARIRDCLAEITRAADQMAFYAADPPQSLCTESCILGRFGNKLCAYFDVCNGDAALSDDSMYEDKVPKTEEAEV